MEGPRVPAWKRLGLKLKYAQEIDTATSPLPTSQQVNSDGFSAAATSTSQVNGHSVTSPPSKKRRLEGRISPPADDTTNALKRSSSLKGSGSNIRKSVSFTPETKEDDGESSTFMQDKWDEEARNDQINEFLAREAEDAEAAANLQNPGDGLPDSSDQATNVRKPKREKKERRHPEQPTLDIASRQLKSTGKSKDALDYLNRYQSSRSTWKFNKNREVWLLKHILSKSDIPSSYESALFEYLSGMKSDNSKARLIDQCHDCIVDQVESGSDDSGRALISKSLKMDTTSRRLAYYRAANQKFDTAFQSTVSGDVSQTERDLARNRHERVDRAATLLESLLVSYVDEDGDNGTSHSHTNLLSQEQPASNSSAGQAVQKKRKNRTAVVDISSSEDTSSDSSSDSDT
jgi:hypothetical protein